MLKECSKCGKILSLTEFGKDKTKKDGFNSSCKNCKLLYRKNKKEHIDNKNKEYYKNNKEKVLGTSKEWYETNKEYVAKYNKIYRTENKKEIRKTITKYRENNKGMLAIKRRKYENNRLKSDFLFKLKHTTRTLVRNSFRYKAYGKNTKTEEILGCSFNEFKVYLESKFESWMNWNNKGLYNGIENYGWDIDHIIPLSTANTEDDVIKLNHYTNLQPLCSKVNRDIKKNNIEYRPKED